MNNEPPDPKPPVPASEFSTQVSATVVESVRGLADRYMASVCESYVRGFKNYAFTHAATALEFWRLAEKLERETK